MLTMVAESEANVGLLLDAAPSLSAAIEPLRAATEALAARSVM